MWFKKKQLQTLPPPEGLGRAQIAVESSICTGETIIGFRDPGSGRLEQAVVVRSEADIRAFYDSYGFELPENLIFPARKSGRDRA